MNSNEDSIARQLKAEADQLREPFSPGLHARVMQSIRQTQPDRTIWATPRWLTGVAAGLVVAAIVIAFAMTTRVPNNKPYVLITPTSTQPNLGIVREVVFDTADPIRQEIRQALPASAMADLDTDVQNLGRFISRQFDQLPQRTEATR